MTYISIFNVFLEEKKKNQTTKNNSFSDFLVQFPG